MIDKKVEAEGKREKRIKLRQNWVREEEKIKDSDLEKERGVRKKEMWKEAEEREKGRKRKERKEMRKVIKEWKKMRTNDERKKRIINHLRVVAQHSTFY